MTRTSHPRKASHACKSTPSRISATAFHQSQAHFEMKPKWLGWEGDEVKNHKAARHDAALDEFAHQARHGVWQISLFCVPPPLVKHLAGMYERKGLRRNGEKSLRCSWRHQTVSAVRRADPKRAARGNTLNQ